MFNSAQEDVIEEYIEEVFDSGIVLSNYFNKSLNNIEFYKTKTTILLNQKTEHFSRIYFLTSNIDNLIESLSKINTPTVINFPTKQNIEIFDAVMISSGFKKYRVYEMYFSDDIKGNDIFVKQFATLSDFERVKFLLFSSLDHYADHLPNDTELKEMIINENVLVNYENNEISGIFIFTIKGKQCYFNFWVDISKNGLFLLYNMYNYLKELGISYSYLWVNTENNRVLKIHKLFKCRTNGTKDYIYTKLINQ